MFLMVTYNTFIHVTVPRPTWACMCGAVLGEISAVDWRCRCCRGSDCLTKGTCKAASAW